MENRMSEFKAGDEVEVYNDVTYRRGKILCVLSCEYEYPLVVEHYSFGKSEPLSEAEEKNTPKVYQSFSWSGISKARNVRIRPASSTKVIVCNVYLDPNYPWFSKWYSEGAGKLARDSTCVGYFKGDIDIKTGEFASTPVFIPILK
jgi:hypothetical protein